MSQFAQSGSAMDEGQSSDGDGGFLSVNQRLQLNQLEVGEVRESLNGRMDGYWKPRRGIVARTGSLTSGGSPLQLPFFLVGTSVAITAASVTSNVVTLTTASAHGLTNGSAFSTSGIIYTTGTNPNNSFIATTASGTSITYPLVGGSGTYTTSATSEVLTSSSKTISSATVSAGVITITTSVAHGLTVGQTALARVTGLAGATTPANTVINGDFSMTVISSTTLEYSVPGLTVLGASTGTLSTTPINDAANVNVRASCLFSDPNSANAESVVLALDSKAILVNLNDYTTQDVKYPTSESLSGDTDMIQAFDRVFLFRDGFQAFEWFPNGRQIESASSSAFTVTMRIKDHGLKVGDSIVVSGLTGGTPANGTFAVVSITDKDVFTYTFTTSQTQTFVVTNAILKAGFTLVPGGAYTQPQVFVSTTGTVTAGVVSLTVSGNTTIVKGDTIVVYETNIPTFSAISGQSFEVLSATDTNISFIAPVANLASIPGAQQIEFGGRFSVGGGFIHQPAPPWGVYFQRRLWVPFYYTPAGTFSSPTYTSRGITDEIAVSDILDSHTFDQIANQFRITGGTADYLVAMQGFYDDKLVVLNRNSLHLISGTTGSLNDTRVTALTTEVGCLAKKSVVMKGNAMFFLSDQGVYAVEFLNDYNLRGADEPISKNIQPYIDRINKNLAKDAVGVLFNNRYYLAVALDSTEGANNATGNNTILVFNFLNKGWESIDTFGANDFLIKNLIIGSAAERNNIYAVTSLGGLHELECAESSLDNLLSSGVPTSFSINSSLTTRGYSLGNLDRKRFTDGQVTMQCVNGGLGEYSISFAAEDPDNNQPIGTTTTFLDGTVLGTGSASEDETGNIRFRLGGIRGYLGTLTLTRTIGSPKITSIKVTGSVTNRQIISQK